MPHFIVTFRIKSDSSYQERYDSFIEQVREDADLLPWDQTTSFLAFRSKDKALSAQGLCNRLYVYSKFDSSKDIMVVVNLDDKTKATQGDIEYLQLLSAGLGF